MRWSELAGKDIINVEDANRLGRVDQADLLLLEDGGIDRLVTGVRGNRRARGGLSIPWDHVVRIGPQAMLVSAPREDGRRAPARSTVRNDAFAPPNDRETFFTARASQQKLEEAPKPVVRVVRKPDDAVADAPRESDPTA